MPDAWLVMIAMFQNVFHNIMTCRVYRMMRLESDLGFGTTQTNVTTVAFGTGSFHPQVTGRSGPFLISPDGSETSTNV